MDIADLLALCLKQGASDLHVSAGRQPMLRIDGELQPCAQAMLTPEQARRLIHSVMTPAQRQAFESAHEADFAYVAAQSGRFRVNAFEQQRGVGAVFRRIGATLPSLCLWGWTTCSVGFGKCRVGWCWLRGQRAPAKPPPWRR